MKPPERFKRRVFPTWKPPADGWQSITHHEAAHVVVAQCYGLTPHRAVVDLHNCCGHMLLRPLPVDPPAHDEERAALGVFGIVGLADASNMFEEVALRSAVILMAGQQAELMRAGVVPAGVLRLNDQDTRQASYLLRLIFNTDVALGWAQLQARYLLSRHWKRVEKIASELQEKGYWPAQKSRKQPARKPANRRARMIGAMLCKLEVNPHRRYSEVLSSEELTEATLMIGAAVACVQECMAEQRYSGRRVKPPARFEWRGSKYPLQYSNMGRVFIATPSGARVIGSGFFAI